MGIGSSKEGVSVYGLLQRCVTGMVRELGCVGCAECWTTSVHISCVFVESVPSAAGTAQQGVTLYLVAPSSPPHSQDMRHNIRAPTEPAVQLMAVVLS